ncbi:XRE family transcriptional regulator [Allokutzneria sp. A3M-2-11 16]|uniref:helix-turn-helix domain-containing protein n=1 Tax=Allokutzneria sp. A3M-2-11 16 TaxID=2962043 RepID=UPI0020B7A32F|nr:XRE family transcriptional regulator [Allokutzneria sp. A3M-2-11 16]MCP3800622.1 XRE family transcriptional regulator [Allokutzneria sp. A3M-2-11 16]
MAVFSSDAHATARAFDPSRLSMARELAGLRGRELADAVGLAPAAVSRYELGQLHPDPCTLARCADHLGVRVGFFAQGRPHLRLDTAHAHFRSLHATTAAQRAQALAHVELLWELTTALDEVAGLPAADLSCQHDGPERAAHAVRRAWGVETGPVPHLVRAVEARGVVVSRLPAAVGANVGVFSCALPDRPVIVLTEREDPLRQRFSVAHELGHLLLHPDAAPGSREHESAADAFAAEFLTPAEEIAGTFPLRADLDAVKELADAYGISVTALAARARGLGLMTDAAHRRLLTELAKRGWRAAEPVRGEYPGEQPNLLCRAMVLAEEHGVDVPALAVRLRVDIATLRGLTGFTERHESTPRTLRLV